MTDLTAAPETKTAAPGRYRVTVSPHLKSPENTRSIMLDVIIAMIPALAASVFFFGWRSLVLTIISCAACVFFEWGYRKLLKKDSSIGDLSAIVTGMLLAFCCPATMPYWMVVIGAFFAIVIVKQLYGGLGKNFMNPALIARVFMLSWPAFITRFTPVFDHPAVFKSNVDAVTTATPLGSLTNGVIPDDWTVMDLFLGQVPGCLGEVSAALILLGGLYLIFRKVITVRIPLAYIATVAILTFCFPRGNDSLTWMLYNLLSGGLFLGAFFMATDYVTSPCTKVGQWIYGIGCGLLTVFIRYFGSYPEGVSFAILIMNACSWLIDKAGRPTRFGLVKGSKKEAASK